VIRLVARAWISKEEAVEIAGHEIMPLANLVAIAVLHGAAVLGNLVAVSDVRR